ncbi:hypothetical protein [Streptobacillus moniliformis]|uniref:hypothetical protein n=1 Tax=Streptobacillus moniliformis TaxID=34105 RepID=UPI0007E42E21|nr:hypothetical protein [Streptobacillus moniliformis]
MSNKYLKSIVDSIFTSSISFFNDSPAPVNRAWLYLSSPLEAFRLAPSLYSANVCKSNPFVTFSFILFDVLKSLLSLLTSSLTLCSIVTLFELSDIRDSFVVGFIVAPSFTSGS